MPIHDSMPFLNFRQFSMFESLLFVFGLLYGSVCNSLLILLYQIRDFIAFPIAHLYKFCIRQLSETLRLFGFTDRLAQNLLVKIGVVFISATYVLACVLMVAVNIAYLPYFWLVGYVYGALLLCGVIYNLYKAVVLGAWHCALNFSYKNYSAGFLSPLAFVHAIRAWDLGNSEPLITYYNSVKSPVAANILLARTKAIYDSMNRHNDVDHPSTVLAADDGNEDDPTRSLLGRDQPFSISVADNNEDDSTRVLLDQDQSNYQPLNKPYELACLISSYEDLQGIAMPTQEHCTTRVADRIEALAGISIQRRGQNAGHFFTAARATDLRESVYRRVLPITRSPSIAEANELKQPIPQAGSLSYHGA
jgi:hypothetical protein